MKFIKFKELRDKIKIMKRITFNSIHQILSATLKSIHSNCQNSYTFCNIHILQIDVRNKLNHWYNKNFNTQPLEIGIIIDNFYLHIV